MLSTTSVWVGSSYWYVLCTYYIQAQKHLHHIVGVCLVDHHRNNKNGRSSKNGWWLIFGVSVMTCPVTSLPGQSICWCHIFYLNPRRVCAKKVVVLVLVLAEKSYKLAWIRVLFQTFKCNRTEWIKFWQYSEYPLWVCIKGYNTFPFLGPVASLAAPNISFLACFTITVLVLTEIYIRNMVKPFVSWTGWIH